MDNTDNLESSKPGGNHNQLLTSAQKEISILRARIFELYTLYTLSKTLNMSAQVNGFFENIINILKNSLKIEEFCFLLKNEECNDLKVWKANGDIYDTIKDVSFKTGEGLSGIAADSGEPILINDVSKDKRFLYYKDKIPNIGSFMSIPLKLSNNKVIGVLNLHKRETNAFKEHEKTLFCDVAQDIAHTIERAKLYEKAQKESISDYLTKLYTRKYFLDTCYREHNKAERYEGIFSVIIADIDYFKYLNDTYGHSFGDEILKKLAYILKSNVREMDVVSRYGGEEFAILLPGTEKVNATLIAEKLRATVEKELVIVSSSGEAEKTTITAGISTYPQDGKTVEEIIAAADKFLYIGKEHGRNRVIHTALFEQPKTHEKRLHNRYKTTLKAARGMNHILYLEIKANNKDWKMCALNDISETGFKGEVEYELEINNIYTCKVVSYPEIYTPNVFSIRVTNAKKVGDRYQIGAELTGVHNEWKKMFTLMTHQMVF